MQLISQCVVAFRDEYYYQKTYIFRDISQVMWASYDSLGLIMNEYAPDWHFTSLETKLRLKI